MQRLQTKAGGHPLSRCSHINEICKSIALSQVRHHIEFYVNENKAVSEPVTHFLIFCGDQFTAVIETHLSNKFKYICLPCMGIFTFIKPCMSAHHILYDIIFLN